MSESHVAYLNLGSNIQPETNLPKAVQLLFKYGEIQKMSNVWESEPVGSKGPNYLNTCIQFKSTFGLAELKEEVIRPIEAQLGRERTSDKYSPRTIDIDIVLFDDKHVNTNFWEEAYVVVPLAEIYPEYQNPVTGEKIVQTATRVRRRAWLEKRQGVLG